jgi:hypothetical protein
MPDRLEAVRDAVQAVVEPVALEQRAPFSDLVERASRRRRRRWQVAAGAVVLVVGGGLLLSKPVSDQIATPPAASKTTTPVQHGSDQLIQSMLFADPQHGVAVVISCNGPGYRCAARATTLRTTDGGRTWQRLPNPAENGPGEMVRVWEVTEYGVVMVVEESYYYSTDLRTWHLRPADPVDEGGAVESIPADRRADTVKGRTVALDPLTNRYRRLAHQPDLPVAPSRWTTTSGPDHRVIAATDDDHGTMLLAYSEDRGRTWRKQDVPTRRNVEARMVLTSDSSDRIYLVEGDPSGRLEGISRLDHLGGTWSSVPVPERIRADQSSGTMKVVRMLPDGELLFDVDGPFRTEDAGTRLVNVTPMRIYGFLGTPTSLQNIGGTMIANIPPGIDQPAGVVPLLVSTDSGRTWTLREWRLVK